MGKFVDSDINEILEFACALHTGQSYHNNGVDEPYSNHIRRVYDRVSLNTVNYPTRAARRALVAAVFHDSIEDEVITESALRILVGDEICNVVMALTRKKEEETYAEYIDRVILHGAIAMEVKLADLDDNLQHAPKGSLRLRYEKARSKIQNELISREIFTQPTQKIPPKTKVWTPEEACSPMSPFEHDQDDVVLVDFDSLLELWERVARENNE